MHNARIPVVVVFLSLITAALLMGQAAPSDCPIFDPPPDDEPYQWYQTCGDPVCSGFSPSGNGLCTTEMVGDSCGTQGDTCDLDGNGCNVRLLCTDSDPTQQPGGCPISRADRKTDISYLDSTARDAIADELLSTKLATYKYTGTERTNLGFIIEDVEPSMSVYTEADKVDLYGYTSMAVATIQRQQEQIAKLEAELAALKKLVEAKQD